jgi:hypothetical protein
VPDSHDLCAVEAVAVVQHEAGRILERKRLRSAAGRSRRRLAAR